MTFVLAVMASLLLASLAAAVLLHLDGELFTAETWGLHAHTFVDDECPCGAVDYGFRDAA